MSQNTGFHGINSSNVNHDIKKSDESFIKIMLNNIKNKKYPSAYSSQLAFKNPVHSVSHQNHSLSIVKKTLGEIIQNCKEVKKIETFLRDNPSLSSVIWDEKYSSALKLKEDISKKLETVKDPALSALLKKRISKNVSKRRRMKRRKIELRNQTITNDANKVEKSKEIDKWMNLVKTRIDSKKKENDLKIETDIVLRDVTKRKAEARRCLSLLEALATLRQAKETTSKGRGEEVNSADRLNFYSNIGKLKYLWTKNFDNYVAEEKKLRAMLHTDYEATALQSTIEPILDISSITSKWQNIMFGMEGVPQRDFQGDLTTFICNRSKWDVFLKYEGSKLPRGWVIPMSPNEKWNKYLDINSTSKFI